MTQRLAWSLPELVENGALGKTSTLYQHIHAGRLDAFKVGRRTMVTHESVMRLLNELPRWKPGRPPACVERKRRAAASGSSSLDTKELGVSGALVSQAGPERRAFAG